MECFQDVESCIALTVFRPLCRFLAKDPSQALRGQKNQSRVIPTPGEMDRWESRQIYVLCTNKPTDFVWSTLSSR